MIEHHGDHRGLLTEFDLPDDVEAQHGDEDDVNRNQLDAVVVPSGRGAKHLTRAIELAEYLGTPLVALCSRYSRADDVERFAFAGEAAIEVKAVDMPVDRTKLGDLSTTAFLRGEGLLSPVDTSVKRNVGLAIAQLCGWRRVLYLDDDVTVPVPHHLRLAAGLLGRYGAVGLDNIGYRDNSVVCHAYRSLPGRADEQKQFISTMALLVDPIGVRSFFPHIYNEDWLYLIADDSCRERLAVAGKVIQDAYDPFKPDRAVREELGDTIAEGLFWLLDNARESNEQADGSSCDPAAESVWKRADREFWAGYLAMRRGFIAELREAYVTLDKYEQVNAMDAAAKESAEITPEACAEYVRRWQDDLCLWQQETSERTFEGVDLDEAIETVLNSTWHM